MPLEIAYCTYSSRNHYGKIIATESRTLTATSQLAANATPSQADFVRLTANGEAARFDYSSAASSAAADAFYLASGDSVELDAVSGWKVAGRTA